MLIFTIKSIKHSDLCNSLHTNSYTDGIQQTDMYANLHQPKYWGKNDLLKKKLKY